MYYIPNVCADKLFELLDVFLYFPPVKDTTLNEATGDSD